MKSGPVIALGLLAFACTLGKQGLASGPPAAESPGRAVLPGAIRISFPLSAGGAALRSTGPGQADLDFGRVSYATGARTSGVSVRRTSSAMHITTRFAVQLDSAGGGSQRTVTLSAFLLHADSRQRFKVDDVELTTTPQVIQAQVPLGTVSMHRLELEIPKDAPAGTISNAIGWVAVAD
ncbi:MAG TPA: hypothetical protein VNK82_05810 [Terriglobales bacterium]|nr:hypothetical protein [Terriglobales bacterium]